VSCAASKAVSSVSTGRAGALTLARPMFDLDGQRVARSARDLKSIPEEPGNAAVVASWAADSDEAALRRAGAEVPGVLHSEPGAR